MGKGQVGNPLTNWTRRMEKMVEARFEPSPQAPAEARGAVEGLARELRPGEFHALQLLVSELVTNSVRHAGLDREEWIGLRVDVRPGAVRGTVTDAGPGFDPPRRRPRPGEESGWGLFLVERLADRWGVDRDGRTRVWFELLRPASRAG